jgi:hypothetical protein
MMTPNMTNNAINEPHPVLAPSPHHRPIISPYFGLYWPHAWARQIVVVSTRNPVSPGVSLTRVWGAIALSPTRGQNLQRTTIFHGIAPSSI